MAFRVFLHIGAPKTGTTFLQTVMWNNREQLRACGVLYPGEKRMDHYHSTRVVRGVPAVKLGRNAGVWERIVTELASWPGTGVVSHEFFSMATAEQAEAAIARLAPAEVHVVLTARDYQRQFPAMWQEALKMNSDLSLDEFMDQALSFSLRGAWGWQSQDVPQVLERWGQSLPTGRVHVITVPRPGAPRDLLWRRWCQVIGIDPDRFDLDVAYSNESMGAAQAALVRRVKPHLSEVFDAGDERHRWFRQYFGHEVLVPQDGGRFRVRPRHAAALRELSVKAVGLVSEAGYDVVGDLAELVPEAEQVPASEAGADTRDGSAPFPYPDDCSDSELLEVATRAIEQMVRDVRELTLERNEWRRRATATDLRGRVAQLRGRLAGVQARRRTSRPARNRRTPSAE